MSTLNITSDGTYITDYPNAVPVLNRRINFADEKDPYYYKTIWDTMSKDEQLEIVDWLNATQGVEYTNLKLAEKQIQRLQQENKNLKHNNEMHEKSIANLHVTAEKLIKEKTTVKVVTALLIPVAVALGAAVSYFVNK